MPQLPRRRTILLAGLCLGIAALAIGLYLRLSHQVQAALEGAPKTLSPLQFVEVPLAAFPTERWGGGEVTAVAATPTALITAGSFGIADDGGDISSGLPTLKATALTLWRSHPVAALAAGGLFLRRDGRWQEARCSFSPLTIRALLEGPGGELWIGAQQGLFLATWAADVLERVDAAPVRALALAGDGTLLAGGESGLKQVVGKLSRSLPTPDPWIDAVGFLGKEVWVLTPLGLARGPLGGTLLAMPGGLEVRSAAQSGSQLFAMARDRLLRFDAAGRAAEEFLPVPPRRVLTAAGLVFADTDRGLFRRTTDGWILARPRPVSLPPGPSHVTALALWKGKVMAGLFDGGLIAAENQGSTLSWQAVPDSRVWGVNALQAADAILFVASLRGAVRYDGRKFEPVAAGPAFSLADTPEGLAIGFGHGVQLPDARFLSAFHGLPGNQALALVAGAELYVGTPSGLGAIAGSKVVWRVTAGDGKLSNPWVTALSLFQKGLFIGSYGGGVVRRSPSPDGRPGPGEFEPFPETRGFKVNAGCLQVAGGRLYLGTEGRGLFRLNADGTRFVQVSAPLPSPRVTALLHNGPYLLVGTDEGLARLPLSLLREGS